MRIALNAMLLQGQFSGVVVAIHNLLRAITAAAPHYEFLVIVPPGFEDPLLYRSSVTCHHAPAWTRLRAGRIIWEQACLPGLLSSYRVDLLHAPGYTMPLRWRGPTILTVYDILALTHPQWCKVSNSWHYRLMLPRSIRAARRVIVPSETVKQELVALLGTDPLKVSVISLGVDAVYQPVTAPAKLQAVRERYALPANYLLRVGNIEPKKNVEGTVRVFEQIARRLPHHLVIVGRLGWKYRRALARIRTSVVGERIHLLGYVPAEDLPALYSGAGACLHLSLYEGFGLPPLEAMRCGVPVVVSDRGALPEVVGDGALVVDPDSSEAAEAIVHLLTDSELRTRVANKGRARAAEFTWAAAAAQLLKVYQEVGEDGQA